jgi:hypothetical protein
MTIKKICIVCGNPYSFCRANNRHSYNEIIEAYRKLENSILKGTLKIEESNSFYSNVVFSDINITSSVTCSVSSFNPSTTTIANKESISFDANITCTTSPAYLKVSFTEKADYVDTSLHTVTKTFTKNILIDTTSSQTDTNTSLSLFSIASVQPSSATIQTGDKFTFYVYTFDADNNPISTTVKISPPVVDGNVIGEFDSYLINTDSNGKGSFTYTAPDSLDSDEINLTVPVIFGNNIEKNLTISVKKQT